MVESPATTDFNEARPCFLSRKSRMLLQRAVLCPLIFLSRCGPLQLIRKQLKKCYKESGVNYQQNCRELAQVGGAGQQGRGHGEQVPRHCDACSSSGLAGSLQSACCLAPFSSPPSPVCTPQNYLSAIKGVGIYRANAGPHDEPRWEAYNAARK